MAATAFVLLPSLIHNAHAAARYTRGQMSAMGLPAYCGDSELSTEHAYLDPARRQYWNARMGPQFFVRIHHYCLGLVHLKAAKSLSRRSADMPYKVRQAIGEFNFLLEWPPEQLMGFPLWPEMLAKRAEAAILIEDWNLAYSSLEDAWRVKPDYWPAYLTWAEVLVKFGKAEEARAILRQGLEQAPSAEPLRQLFVKAGGKLADLPAVPVPAAASAPDQGEAPQPGAASATPEPAASQASQASR